MRYQYLDIFRGLCIVLMVLFHVNYSLMNIFESDILHVGDNFWYILGKISALGFMMIAGFSFFLAKQKYSKSDLQKKYLKYSGILAVIALLITLITYLVLPGQLILFGILHFFALSFLILPYITSHKILQFSSVICIFFLWLYLPDVVGNPYVFPLGYTTSTFYSADYYPIIPYFLYILLGYYAGEYMYKYNILWILHISGKLGFMQRVFLYIGKKSLLIYIIHQPIIIGSLYIFFLYKK